MNNARNKEKKNLSKQGSLPFDVTEEPGPYSMTEEDLRERLGRQKYGRISTQIFAGIMAAIGTFSLGTSLGWSHPFLMEQYPHHKDNNEKLSWVACILPFGFIFGIPTCNYLLENIGPRRTILYLTPFACIFWYIMSFDARLDTWIACRFFVGFFSMPYVICGEPLLADSVNMHMMNFAYVINRSSRDLGVLVVHVMGYTMSNYLVNLICGTIPCIHALMVYIAPDSPVYLYAGGEKPAEKSLIWYRGNANIIKDLKQVKKEYEFRRVESRYHNHILYSKVVIKSIGIIIGVFITKIFSGYYIILFCNVYFWYEESNYFNPFMDSVAISISLYVSKLMWLVIHAHVTWPIRKTLIASAVLSSIYLTVLSSYLLVLHYDIRDAIQYRWIPLMIVPLLIFSVDMGLGYYPNVLIIEYIPVEVRKTVKMIVESASWVLVFANVKAFLTLRVIFCSGYIFIVSTVCSYAGIVFCYCYVVETKNRSFIQIQLDIGGNPVGHRNAGAGMDHDQFVVQ